MASPAIANAERPVDAGALFKALVDRGRFAKAAQQWSQSVSHLSSWEADNILVDNPPPKNSAAHKEAVERLIHLGQLLAFIASYPDFDDIETAEMIHATQIVLRDKLRMWHGPKVTRQKADQILNEVFPES